MPTAVVHHARVAWDFAQQAVAAAGDPTDGFAWFLAQLGAVLGPDHQRELLDTRDRIARDFRPDIRSVEIGRWRVRIEDMLRAEPDLAVLISALRLAARERFGAPTLA
jgi:hypothetical protein